MSSNSPLVFYSHAMASYGSLASLWEYRMIQKAFPGCAILNVEDFDDSALIQDFLEAEKKCDLVVFSEYKGAVGSGVAAEIQGAMDEGIPIFHVSWRGVLPWKGTLTRVPKEQGGNQTRYAFVSPAETFQDEAGLRKALRVANRHPENKSAQQWARECFLAYFPENAPPKRKKKA